MAADPAGASHAGRLPAPASPSAAASAATSSSTASEKGPVVEVLRSLTGDGGSLGGLRQVLVVTLGAGFLTAGGFAIATWQARRPR